MLKSPRAAILAVVAGLLLVCYAPVLRGMADQWTTDKDMGHGWFVPAVALWIVWRERPQWRGLPRGGGAWGFGLLALGAALHAASVIGAGLFAGSAAFLVSLAGVVAVAGGTALLRAWAFPLLLLAFMLPKLAVVYNQVTLPLQLTASRLAAAILTSVGIAVSREGNILQAGNQRLAVEEACNGIRYLYSLGFLAVVFGYIADGRTWMRVALLAATVPLAIVANAARVAATAAYPALAEGALHALAGWLIFVACLAALAGLRRAIQAVCGVTPRVREPAPALAPPGRPPRLSYVALLLAAQAIAVGLASGVESPPPAPDLSGFPDAAGEWVKLREDAEAAAQAQADRSLGRTYLHSATGETAGLLVAWFQSQRRGERQPHSPKVCLPGSGWEPQSVGELTIETGEGAITVNRYIVASRNQRLAILYWFQTPRRVVAGEWAAKIYLVADAMRDRRTDAALVRVAVPVGEGDDARAIGTAAAFVQRIFPLLRQHLPRLSAAPGVS